ncbi:hypothetical protein [Microbacterium rhizosphaerae]|uniref:Uncharacterized protein n=1 Tax=Microbacterium rhizosphaerae TaxID=1678237 RepID=A0ABZ0SIS9_9MICO|nr:hypothetical protein [Microbacterium rhizosphaerae]WPR88764.1 hypothetical protein SM116_13440 [Microbacterium rhizosphaerae]
MLDDPVVTDRSTPPPSLLRWTALCAAAETLGMAASAVATRTAQTLVADPARGLWIIVAGGLIEGMALGVAQGAGLARWLHGRRLRWVLVTVLVAGIGWAAGSAPAALTTDEGGGEPPRLLILAGAAGLGLVMGALLGAAQAVVLRGRAAHPWRWIPASALGWTAAMPVVFLGAGFAGADWPLAAVAALGAVTGMVGGAVLGLVSGPFLRTLQGPRVRNGRADASGGRIGTARR